MPVYTPKPFQQNDPTQLIELIANHPLATLVGDGTHGLEAIHIPLYYVEVQSGKKRLRGHIAKANTLTNMLDNKASVLVIFQGPQTYITPSFYPTKKEHGKAVPTWNYVSVHVRGELQFIDDTEWKLDMLNTLTDQLEQKEMTPWKVSDAPEAYIEKLLNAIVGIEISIESMEGQWKLSQNQPAKNVTGVIDGLSISTRAGARSTLEIMKKVHNKLGNSLE